MEIKEKKIQKANPVCHPCIRHPLCPLGSTSFCIIKPAAAKKKKKKTQKQASKLTKM
jgi:hypothetical protein